MVRQAACIFNYYRKDTNGKTPWEHAKGRPFTKKVAIVGESVLFLLPGSLGHDKLDSRWGSGIWLGIYDDSGEYLVGTSKGVIKTRTFKRKADPTSRWNMKEIYEMKGTPWQPYPNDKFTFKDLKPKVSFEKPNQDVPTQPNTEEKESKKHRLPIKRSDMKHDRTEHC
jgi:hypothetical protein